MKILATGAMTSWQIDAENLGTVTDFISLGSKITADGDYSHEFEDTCSLGKEAMINLDSVLKSRYYFVDKGICVVKALIFPVVI